MVSMVVFHIKRDTWTTNEMKYLYIDYPQLSKHSSMKCIFKK